MAAHERPDGSLNALSILQITLYPDLLHRLASSMPSMALLLPDGKERVEASRSIPGRQATKVPVDD